MSSLAELVLEQIADAVIYADEKGTIRWWNHAAAILFGYTAPEAVGRNLDLIIPEHLRAAHWRGFETAMTRGVMKRPGPPTRNPATHRAPRNIYLAKEKGKTHP